MILFWKILSFPVLFSSVWVWFSGNMLLGMILFFLACAMGSSDITLRKWRGEL